ncbi:unnamed protein product [Miscanthus lutarioriparius]|uniref:MINDY deubiquitinase domain-containing protein n=1 Tax=Miscanthus lutarioriparius TaxID=422564 RepID=A0A811S536_9POAL|nr:unnamed protein product [Miscanthus lutarioriparius]
MERLSAKESLLLALVDTELLRHFSTRALVSGKTTEMQRIDVNERIVGLERLNPTPRPTTRSPTAVAHFTGLDVSIKDGYSKLSSNLKFLNTIQSKFLLTTQLSVEGPIRMKEEYVEGLIEIPRINEESLPEQLKGLLGQTAGALQQLPSPIRDVVSEGLKVPLGELIDNFLQTTANQLTVYGYISNNLWFKCMFSIVFSFITLSNFIVAVSSVYKRDLTKYNGSLYLLATYQGFISQTDLVWQRLDEVNGDGVFLTSNFTPFKAETPRNDSWNEQQAMTSTANYLAQFDNTSGNSNLELAIALQQQEFERQPQRFQAPPPQQQQQQ